MRKTLLTTVTVFGLAVAPAFAQNAAPMSNPTGGGSKSGSTAPANTSPGGTGSGTAATDTGTPAAGATHRTARGHTGSPSPAAVANTATGARPGNEPGTNNSLPMSTQASNISQTDTRSPIAPRLPDPSVGANGSPEQYLAAARQALSRHRTGEAQQALEMAETRALDRSAGPDAANSPDQNPMITQIGKARDALARRDMAGADAAISAAMSATPRS